MTGASDIIEPSVAEPSNSEPSKAEPSRAERAGVDVWGGVVGQVAAVDAMRAAAQSPVHAYLFVGPRGSGKRALAHAFAAALLSEGHDGAEVVRQAELALAGIHPDLELFERAGKSLSVDDADAIITSASRSSVEGGPKVLVLDEFHLVGTAAPKLLKTIEEPPTGTVFLVLADDISPELITIASRCVRIDLSSVDDALIEARLLAEGVDPVRAAEATASAAGDLARARVLATDQRLALRRAAWREVPDRLDGTGACAVELVDSLLAMITDAMTPLTDAHAAEVAELEQRIKELGERGSGRKQLEDRHKREARRYRTDEFRFGLTELSRRYRDDLVVSARPAADIEAIGAIADLAASLIRNPNERLQLIALFVRLGRLR